MILKVIRCNSRPLPLKK